MTHMNPRDEGFAKQFVVRGATAPDAAAIASLLWEAFREFEALYTREAFAATVLSEAGVLARMREGPLWVAETGSSIICSVGGTVGTIQVGDVVTIRGMAALPSVRGLGVGKNLLDHVERFAAHERAGLLELYTTAFLDGAIRLYQAAGFAFTGETINPSGTELLRMTKAVNR